jgi:hypothetical protein
MLTSKVVAVHAASYECIWRSRGKCYSLLTLALDGVVSSIQQLLHLWGKCPPYPFSKRLGTSQNAIWKRKISCSHQEPHHNSCCPAHSLVVTLAVLPWFLLTRVLHFSSCCLWSLFHTVFICVTTWAVSLAIQHWLTGWWWWKMNRKGSSFVPVKVLLWHLPAEAKEDDSYDS